MGNDEQSSFMFKGQTVAETKYLMHMPMHGHRSWDTYASGYRKAAEIVAEHVLDYADNAGLVNEAGLPLIYLWRHYLELRLKSIINWGGERYSAHCLVDNWNTIIGMIKKVVGGVHMFRGSGSDGLEDYKFDKLTDEDYNRIKQILAEFDSYDKDSETFRYPEIRKNGLLDDAHIDLKNLSESMGQLANILDEISSYLATYYDLEREYAFEC